VNKLVKNIVAFSLRNRFLVLFVTVILAVVGFISYQNTPLEAFPDVTNTQITIITQWPGRSAEEIEKLVTAPLEIALNACQKKTSLRSTTLFGLSVVKVIFEDDVDDPFARAQVNNLIRGVDLPDGVDPEVQPPYGPTGEIYRYTLDSKDKSVRELKTIQDWVIDRKLRAVPGIADIVSFGGEIKTYEISVNRAALADYKISPLDVFNAVNKSNINVGGDVIEKHNQAFVVRGIGLLNSIQEIENIIISYVNTTPILVKNVATVSESCLPRLGQTGRDKRSNCVEGIVVMRKGENPSEVINRLNEKIAFLNSSVLPKGVKINAFYNRENLINFCTETVLHNLTEGILLVTFIVLIFMADWRTTVIVGLIIPLALLFAFICLRLKGMSANLLSIGAIDFGIIIDGAVVMVEGLFVALDHSSHKYGMEKFNKLSKLGLIKNTGGELARAILFSKLIIISCLLPIFSFQKVEGKMFSPLAYTLGFALLGALLFTLTFVPVMVSLLMKKNVREKNNPFVNIVEKGIINAFAGTYKNKKMALIVSSVIIGIGLFCFSMLGTEFLPQLNEGSIYARASLPLSVSLKQSVEMTEKIRKDFLKFQPVKQVMSQTGRPNDGTDPTGFYNIELFVDLKRAEEWKGGISKEELIDQMKDTLSKYPGVNFNFSQPIMDNVEEAVSGVKGSIAVKVYGNKLESLESKADTIYNILNTVEGIEDLGVIRNIGQPELRIELDQNKMALYGVQTADANAVIEMAIGGKKASTFYEGERKFDIRIRFQEADRKSEYEIGQLKVPTLNGSRVPLNEIATIKQLTGPCLIFRDETQRFCAVKFSVRGRDMGSTIAEAQKKVNKVLKLPLGYSIVWAGDFENQQRASKRLMQVLPISLFLIFIILFTMFGNGKDAGLVLFNIPFAIIGGVWALMITHTNFSISAGIGFIAVMGICIQNGVILVAVFKHNLSTKMSLRDSIVNGVKSRIRPVVMTALMAALGLIPAALSHGIGSETGRPLAIVVIGGLCTATVLTLLIFPLIFDVFYRMKHSEL
jgi:cobalt-zinc-cadmium resistance protein CzcA